MKHLPKSTPTEILNDLTYTRVERLDKQGRVEELARLIGGASLTPALIKSAEDLLQQAQEYRNSKAN